MSEETRPRGCSGTVVLQFLDKNTWLLVAIKALAATIWIKLYGCILLLCGCMWLM